MPKTYASKVSREGTDLVLKLKSVKEEQSIEITMDQNYSETNGFTLRYNPLKSEINQTIRLNVDDAYEFDGLILVEGEIQDAFYHADGNWGLDFDTTYTLINNYVVSNNLDRVYEDGELAINRNVKLEVHSEDDYATLYKSLLPGQIPADYNEYQFLYNTFALHFLVLKTFLPLYFFHFVKDIGNSQRLTVGSRYCLPLHCEMQVHHSKTDESVSDCIRASWNSSLY